MKNILILFLSITSYLSFAQQKETVSIDWIDNSGLFSESSNIKIPVFNTSNFQYDFSKGEIFFVKKIAVTGFVDENSLKISDVIYENITQSQLGELNISSIPASIIATITNMSNPASQKAVISVSTIIKENNSFKRIKSFSYTYSYGANRNTNVINNTTTVSNSVLSSGDWYRFYIEKSGVYKISKSFLQGLGMNVNASDARNIKIYGSGGKMLPLLNSSFYPSDLTENAITLVGESDGKFDSQDYILFYADGVDNWNEENLTHNNLYSDRAYFYVTTQGGPGKRIGNMPAISGNANLTINTFDDYQFYEVDKNNIARLGRRWFGDAFNIQNEQEFEFTFPNIVTTSPVSISVTGAAAAFTATSIAVTANAQSLGSLNFSALSPSSDALAAGSILNSTFPASENVKIKLTYNNNGVPSANAYLDYIILKAKRNLQGFGKQFIFKYNDAAINTGIGEYQISNASKVTQVWDITDIYNVSKFENTTAANQFSFKAYLGEDRKYVAIDASNYLTPGKESQSRVTNQNLKGTIFKNSQGSFQDVDYLIVTPASLNSQAERLANFHRTSSNLRVKVVNLEAIYQEFSSGKQDVAAIRNFVKYIYSNASNPANRIKYLNLFGDASYDFKKRIPNNSNIVPAFQSLESFSLQGSFVTDDFFTMFDSNEGRMDFIGSHDLEIAVGRMLVSDSKQAEEMVTKVIEYHAIESYGKWRNNFVLISDDVDKPGEDALQRELDLIGDNISANKPFINVKKIHSDSYVQEAAAGGNRYPKVREDFVAALEQGGLVFNYYGHGGEDGLAHERIFEKTDAQNLNNRYKYPLFVTITCEFTRYDNPYRPTAGEYMFWNAKGGAISLVTTTRPINIDDGRRINTAFSSLLFGFGTNEYVPIAEALRRSKNNYNGSTLMVSYIGDPAITLAIPKPTITLTKINDEPIATSTAVLNALSRIKLTGEVRDLQGNSILSTYNGDLSINIFDKNIQKRTLGNDGITNSGGLIIMDFTLLGETIFRGNASVKNGQFEFEFVVPRDISIPVGNGRASFYAKKTGVLEDQTGFNTQIKIGGINPTATADNVGPKVRLYMNDETFISGGITNESPIFLAFLEDENGINTASGIGHDIIAILDGDENNPFVINDYYETETDDYTKGKVRFPFRNLAVGLHTITFKAWDVYNNPVTSEIQFIVVGDETVTLKNVLNYPNPFVSYTQFWFTHNRPFEPLEVQVQVLTITGKIVKTINQIVTTEGFLSREITWDGRDDFGDKIGKGVYVYKLTVKSTLTNKKTEKYEKLVIL